MSHPVEYTDGMHRRGGALLAATLVLAGTAACQRDLAAWPTDPLRAIGRLPLAAAVDGGTRVLVRAEARAAVAGADVLVVDPKCVDVGTRTFLEAHFGSDRHLVLASVRGTRYRTGEDGTVAVALPPGAVVAACEGGDSGFAVAVAGAVTVTLEQRSEVRVEVIAADGRPAADVPLSVFAGGSNAFSSVACSDRGGRARLWTRRARSLEVRALIAGQKPVKVAIPAGYFDRKAVLLRLDLPVLGRVHATGVLPPDANLALVALGAGGSCPPTRVTEDGAWFDHVALGDEVTARLTQRFRDAQQVTAAGPKTAGEVAAVDASGMLAAARVLTATGRLLGVDGRPMAAARIWAYVIREKGGAAQFGPLTDADGRFELTLDVDTLGDGSAELMVAPQEHKVSGDTPVATVPLPKDPPAAIALGDLRLQEEPVLARGRVVDVDGKPLHAVQVVVRQLVGPEDAMRRPWWTTRSGEDGTFTLRGSDLRRGELRVGVEGKDTLAEDVAAGFGDEGIELRVARPGRLQVAFVDGHPPNWLRIELQKRGAGAKDAPYRGLPFPRIWPGRYDFVMRFLDRQLLLVEDIEVRSSASCTDPRLQAIDWRLYVQEVCVQLLDPAGAPVMGRVLVTAGKDLRESLATDANGCALVPFLEGCGLEAHAAGFRTQVVLRGFEPIQVRLVPRARLRVTAPADVDLPRKLIVYEGEHELAAGVADGDELRPAGDGRITLRFGEPGFVGGKRFRELWRQEVQLRADDLLQVLTLDPDAGR